MRSLAILGSASMLVLISATEGGAESLFVDPGDAGCFATIQAAVQAAASGDVVSIRAKADGSAYNEAVTIETPNLTIAGEGGPTFRSVASMIQFSGLRTVDLDDPDVGLWLDNYPDAQDFLDALATLEGFIAEETLIDECPAVVVEVCGTLDTGSGFCGEESGIAVFSVAASGTSFADLTIRHGIAGIELLADVIDTTVERVCFRNNDIAVESIDVANDGTTIRQSFVDGASRDEGFFIQGDDAVIERNLLLNTEGITVGGGGYQISFNAASITTDVECFQVGGENGVLSYNVGLDCDGALEIDDAVDTLVLGNLFHGVPENDEAIAANDVPESNSAPEPGNRRTVIKNNIIRLVSADGVEFGASDGVFEGNLVERAGNDRSEAGLLLIGNDNDVLYNLIRFSSQRAINIQSFFDVTEDQEVPSSGNLIRGNLLTRNHTSGIHFPRVLSTA